MAGLEPPGVAGMLIEAHRFFRLETCAQDGLRWQTERTIPEIGGSYLDDGFHFLVDGKAREVSFSRPFDIPVTKFYLTLVFFAEVTIPCYAVTQTTSFIAGEQRRTSTSLVIARFSTPSGE